LDHPEHQPFINYSHDMVNAAARQVKKYSGFIQRFDDAAVAPYEQA
jgi:hypothetical protein